MEPLSARGLSSETFLVYWHEHVQQVRAKSTSWMLSHSTGADTQCGMTDQYRWQQSGADTNFHNGRDQNTRSSDFLGLRMRDWDLFIDKLGSRWTQPPRSVGSAGKPAKGVKNPWPAPAVA